MNEVNPSQNNRAKKLITPSQGTYNWFSLSKHVKTIFVSGLQLQKLREILEFSWKRRRKVDGLK